jgi:hypothetical protein
MPYIIHIYSRLLLSYGSGPVTWLIRYDIEIYSQETPAMSAIIIDIYTYHAYTFFFKSLLEYEKEPP